MQLQHDFETLVAYYANLADAQATLYELQDALIPYPNIRLGAQAAHGCPHAGAGDRSATCWSLTVLLDSLAALCLYDASRN